MKTILAIDPGTKCGWCLWRESGCVSGVWNLKEGRFEGGGMRYLRLTHFLDEAHEAADVDMVAFEEVRNHMGIDAAHIYGGIIATITSWCEFNKIPYQGIPVATIKAFATGKGNAKKDAMIAAAAEKWPEAGIKDDNEADARWIAACVASDYHLTHVPNTHRKKSAAK